ncbi:MAG TPA: VTT domain-containing protein [Ferruginibacter sp.]|jgi:membrane-associated protein|nr:VTT domain-containing protein [Ferruginibacter sp.]
MKQILYCLVFSFCALVVKAQDSISIRVRVTDQYQREVEGATVTLPALNIIDTTNSSGEVTLVYVQIDSAVQLPPVDISKDSVSIVKEGYVTKSFAISNFKKFKPLIIYKDFSYKDLFTPMFYIINGGLWLLLLIIFAETGLFIGFFFPGDSLLFVAGIYSHELVEKFTTHHPFIDLIFLTAMISIAGILGNSLGYYFGKRIGPAMFGWSDRFLFRKKYLIQANDFYQKNGGAAIIYARFVPIVRTFAPIIAGIVNMDKKKFGYYNIIGCIAWVASMIFGGHYLQRFVEVKFHFNLKKHLELIVLGIVVITTVPIIFKVFFSKKKKHLPS